MHALFRQVSQFAVSCPVRYVSLKTERWENMWSPVGRCGSINFPRFVYSQHLNVVGWHRGPTASSDLFNTKYKLPDFTYCNEITSPWCSFKICLLFRRGWVSCIKMLHELCEMYVSYISKCIRFTHYRLTNVINKGKCFCSVYGTGTCDLRSSVCTQSAVPFIRF